MGITELDWAQEYRKIHRTFDKAVPGSEESRATWNAKAAGFAHKPQRSDYIHQLIEFLDLSDDETLFDMGCGSGTLAIPLAEQGHNIIAVDFSDGMLAELEKTAQEKGVEDRIQMFQRSWQESWEGLPQADVAISSRSFVTDDLAGGLEKLEGQARNRVVLTCGAGDLPYRDSRVFAAMGREEEALMPPYELVTLANYLWMNGRMPSVSYIEYPGVWHKKTKEALEETIRFTHEAKTSEEEQALTTFLEQHMVYDETNNWWMMDYPRMDRWAVISWKV